MGQLNIKKSKISVSHFTFPRSLCINRAKDVTVFRMLTTYFVVGIVSNIEETNDVSSLNQICVEEIAYSFGFPFHRWYTKCTLCYLTHRCAGWENCTNDKRTNINRNCIFAIRTWNQLCVCVHEADALKHFNMNTKLIVFQFII